jgi:hypothetical protein
MLALLCTISLTYLSITLLLSGMQNLQFPARGTVFNYKLLIKAAKTPTFSLINIIFGIILLASSSSTLLIIICLCVAVIVISGFYVEYKNPQEKCACFGPAVNSRGISLTLRLLTVASAFLFIITTILGQANDIHQYWWANGLAGFCFIIFTCLFLKKKKPTSDSSLSSSKPLNQSGKFWDPTQIIGLDSKRQLFSMSNLKEYPSLVLVIVVSTQCTHCKELLPDVAVLSQSFFDRLGVVVVFQEEPSYFDCGKSLVLYDPDRSLHSNVDAEGTPFALLLRSTDLKQIAPTSYGSDKIRILFALALNVISRSKQDMQYLK